MKLNTAVLTLIVLIGCSAERTAVKESNYSSLIVQIDDLFYDNMFAHAQWGVLIKSLDTDKIWYEKNSEKMFMPASNEKIITTAVSLKNLGPNFKFETQLGFTGEIRDSILNGNLIVSSNGDPTLYERFFENSVDVFKKWAKELKKLGIVRVKGNIIGDDNAFDDNHLGYGWAYNGLDSWYSAEVGALQLNENYVDLKIIPPSGDNNSVDVIPNLRSDYYKIINLIEVTDTGETKIRYNRNFNENIITLRGTVKMGGKTFEVSPSITNPTLFYVTVLKEELERDGIEVMGECVDIDSLKEQDSLLKRKPVAVHYSPPLHEILKVLMKKSQNLYAETMVRALSWFENNLGSFEGGKKIVENTLENCGIKKGSYRFMDGSGLSRYNYVSPEILVKILQEMYSGEYKSYWLDCFPIAGIDGTLKNRMKYSAAENNVIAKTGTISNVRALSGYVKTGNGENLVFSFLINGHLRSSEDTEIITDKVLELISNFN